MLIALMNGCFHDKGDPQPVVEAEKAVVGVEIRLRDPEISTATDPYANVLAEQPDGTYHINELDGGRYLILEATLTGDSPTRTQTVSFVAGLSGITARVSTTGNAGKTGDFAIKDEPLPDKEKIVTTVFEFSGVTDETPAVSTIQKLILIEHDDIYEPQQEEFEILFGYFEGIKPPDPYPDFFVAIQDDELKPQVSVKILRDNISYSNLEVKESAGQIFVQLLMHNSRSSHNITVPLITSGTASPGADYISPGGFSIPAESTAPIYRILLNDDVVAEDDETLILTLGQPDYADLHAENFVEVTLLDEEGNGPLNVTGITDCIDNNKQPNITCAPSSSTSNYPSQDGDDQAGTAFNYNVNYYGETTPQCVEDLNTGLIWEAKALSSTNLRSSDHTFAWNVPYDNANGGNPGGEGIDSNCGKLLESCDTEKYIEAINNLKLCGYSDWRLPSVKELMTLVDYSEADVNLANIDYATAFPNTVAGPYLSSTPVATFDTDVWVVDFSTGAIKHIQKVSTNSGFEVGHVRLVRSGKVVLQ